MLAEHVYAAITCAKSGARVARDRERTSHSVTIRSRAAAVISGYSPSETKPVLNVAHIFEAIDLLVDLEQG
jgi:hypothetical protein